MLAFMTEFLREITRGGIWVRDPDFPHRLLRTPCYGGQAQPTEHYEPRQAEGRPDGGGGYRFCATQSWITCRSSTTLIGFVTKPSMPQARHRARSVSMALAVNATIGIRRVVPFSRERI